MTRRTPSEAGGTGAPARLSVPRLLAMGIVCGALIAFGQVLGEWVVARLAAEGAAAAQPVIRVTVLVAAGAYVLLLMMPFLPGVEIGLALMAMLGADVSPLVYLATVLALSAAFLVGRLVPARVCAGIFGFLGMRRARRLVLAMAPLDEEGRLRLLLARAPRRIVPFLLRHRYLALALAFNLPGNALIGGGGGIAMAAGMSGLFRPPLYLLVVALAVAPVPLAVTLTGWRPLG